MGAIFSRKFEDEGNVFTLSVVMSEDKGLMLQYRDVIKSGGLDLRKFFSAVINFLTEYDEEGYGDVSIVQGLLPGTNYRIVCSKTTDTDGSLLLSYLLEQDYYGDGFPESRLILNTYAKPKSKNETLFDSYSITELNDILALMVAMGYIDVMKNSYVKGAALEKCEFVITEPRDIKNEDGWTHGKGFAKSVVYPK